MTVKWKNLNIKAATAFKNFCVCFKQINVEKKITVLLRVVRKYNILHFVQPDFKNKLVGP